MRYVDEVAAKERLEQENRRLEEENRNLRHMNQMLRAELTKATEPENNR